jgi:hypothetical protein
MSKKDYELIAEAIGQALKELNKRGIDISEEQLEVFLEHLVNRLKETNELFDTAKFYHSVSMAQGS